MIRNTSIRDIVRLEPVTTFPIEHTGKPTCFLKKTCESSDGKLLAMATVKLTTETSIIFAEGTSNIERARAVKELFVDILKDLQNRGFDDNHMFVEDQGFVELIEKHLGFVKIPQTALVKQL